MAEIYRIGLLRAPSEACGVIIPTPRIREVATQVIEVPNRSMNHTTSYCLDGLDVQMELKDWKETATEEDQDRLAIWHTHPEGHIGPSVADLQTRLDGVPYLVVALTASGPVPAWF